MRTLSISLVLVVIISTLGLGWLFDKAYQQYFSHELSPNISSITKQLGKSLAYAANESSDENTFLSNWPNTKLSSVALQNIDNSTLPHTLIEQMKNGEPVVLETINNMVYHYLLPAKNKILILRMPLLSSKNNYSSTQFIWTTAFYVILIFIFFLWANPLIKQLLALRLAAKSFGEGHLERRIKPSSISYIRDIELEFNHMAKRIESLVSDVKMLSTAVSHDLRTPLARIRFGIDTIQEVDDESLRKELEEQLSDDVDEMTSLVETLLRYARLDQNMLEIRKEPVDLAMLIKNCIKRKKSNNVTIQFINDHDDNIISADSKYIHMVINNIIQNAINYGREKVLVELSYHNHNASIQISDNGEGVPVELREQIIKPFFRAKNGTNNIKGHGIGLAIVTRILDWHNGKLTISNATELSGSKFTITLPTNH
jgi:two-component system OmpR family sensor kinase